MFFIKLEGQQRSIWKEETHFTHLCVSVCVCVFSIKSRFWKELHPDQFEICSRDGSIGLSASLCTALIQTEIKDF